MRQRFLPLLVLVLAGSSIFMTSCLKDSCDETRRFVEFEAIFAHPNDFRKVVTFEAQRDLEQPGKIYYYQDQIMINEIHKGIHIYDNSDPSNPTYKGFLNIPGNVDVSIKNGIMYADSYVDLLTVDITDLSNPITLCRDEEVFAVYSWVGEQGYYVGTRELLRTIEVDCSDPNFGDNVVFRDNRVLVNQGNFDNDAVGPTAGAGGTANEATGVGGSFARFSVIDDHLYVINISELKAYDISTPEKPELTQSTNVSWQIETLFPYKQYLFIGGNAGMFIYDRSTPATPTYVSEFRHARACDPVFVKDDIAYVTLRNGTLCEGFINQLDVIDVANIESPTLIKSYEMEHPHGLSVSDNNLYLCEGRHGLKVFNNENLESINQIEKVGGLHAYDAISLTADHLLVIGDDGLYQYDSSNPRNLNQVSHLPTK